MTGKRKSGFAHGEKSVREQLKALYSLALNARYGNEEARQQMREKHGVSDPADYSGFMHGVNESIAVIDSIETKNGR